MEIKVTLRFHLTFQINVNRGNSLSSMNNGDAILPTGDVQQNSFTSSVQSPHIPVPPRDNDEITDIIFGYDRSFTHGFSEGKQYTSVVNFFECANYIVFFFSVNERSKDTYEDRDDFLS